MTSAILGKGFVAAAVLAVLLLSACSKEGGEYEPLEFETFVDGKKDTGTLDSWSLTILPQ